MKCRSAPARSEDLALYLVPELADKTKEDDKVILSALNILYRRMKKAKGPTFTNPDAIKTYLKLKTGGYEHEVFSVAYLDSQNSLIAFEEIFRGTLTQVSVYPREVVKQAIHHNAAGVILSHNHPSGTTQPSRADEALTQTLKSVLAMVDVRVLDHIIVTAEDAFSFAERGLL